MGGDRAEGAEGSDEHTDDPRAEEPGPAVIHVSVETAVEVVEDAAEEQGNDEKKEADSRNRQEYRKCVQFQDVHSESLHPEIEAEPVLVCSEYPVSSLQFPVVPVFLLRSGPESTEDAVRPGTGN